MNQEKTLKFLKPLDKNKADLKNTQLKETPVKKTNIRTETGWESERRRRKEVKGGGVLGALGLGGCELLHLCFIFFCPRDCLVSFAEGGAWGGSEEECQVKRRCVSEKRDQS